MGGEERGGEWRGERRGGETKGGEGRGKEGAQDYTSPPPETNFSLRPWYSIFVFRHDTVMTHNGTRSNVQAQQSCSSPEPYSRWGFIGLRRRMMSLLACHWLTALRLSHTTQ
jgi:hypothetical protein